MARIPTMYPTRFLSTGGTACLLVRAGGMNFESVGRCCHALNVKIFNCVRKYRYGRLPFQPRLVYLVSLLGISLASHKVRMSQTRSKTTATFVIRYRSNHHWKPTFTSVTVSKPHFQDEIKKTHTLSESGSGVSKIGCENLTIGCKWICRLPACPVVQGG